MENGAFISRHNGPREGEVTCMLQKIGVNSLDELIDKTIPANIRLRNPLNLPEPISEYEYLKEFKKIASKNKIFRSYIGMGYNNTIVPSVIKRNILENPSWYTSYTPYQAEISQGRLEALLNFQTMVCNLTGLDIANASLLDEATAAAEAMTMFYHSRSRQAVKNGVNRFIVDQNTFPQTISVLKTRANAFGIELSIADIFSVPFTNDVFGILVQYPNSNGDIKDYTQMVSLAHQKGINVSVAADILSLALLSPPGEWGADVAFGSTQRFGIPMGFGGPHAAYFATKESFKRDIPGRIIGVSVDARGKKALRLALQTREQHIKREKATSNICTAQALLASMAGMYAVYHGSEGLIAITNKIHSLTCTLANTLSLLGLKNLNPGFFDTLLIEVPANSSISAIEKIALSKEINFRYINPSQIGISIDETTNLGDINDIVSIFAEATHQKFIPINSLSNESRIPQNLIRKSQILQMPVFNAHHSETDMMRYIKTLERKDFSLTNCMIPLGSCTMKLNAATEMIPLSWPELADIHPFVPVDQAQGYYQIINELGTWLKEITGFEAISFQPNSGAAGEYTGLTVIRKYHAEMGQPQRNTILIPASAHGTNPASAAMAGFKVVVVECDSNGNIRMDHLKELATQNKETLAGFMVTYPSTHGVFEYAIMEMTDIIHENGGLVYMDGANMNAQVGLTNPATIGADVCHLNLHKTFAIPHGGGGPGVGPIAVNKLLAPYLPTHPVVSTGGSKGINAVSAAPFGSASILGISHSYIRMLGTEGLTLATKFAILNANYIAASLKNQYKILYTGQNGFVAHEMILDCRPFKALSDITETDIAKRLMDYGFHAPTLSFPVHGTLMIEPTESEPLNELNKLIEALITIHGEIMEISNGIMDKKDNVLKNAPHTQEAIIIDEWKHPYKQSKAAFPRKWVLENKFWPSVSRIDDAYGDRNLICTCTPTEELKD
jgi:glycine dehydrogenase